VIGQYVTVAGDVISHVNISRVAVEDGGTYECTAENRVGRATHSAPLRVYGKEIAHQLFSVVVREPLGFRETMFQFLLRVKGENTEAKTFHILQNVNVAVFWDMAPFSPYMNQSFGGTYQFLFHSRLSLPNHLLHASLLLG
jgi:hypothetical protein